MECGGRGRRGRRHRFLTETDEINKSNFGNGCDRTSHVSVMIGSAGICRQQSQDPPFGEESLGKKMGAKCAVVKLNGTEGESPSGPAESRRSLERKN